MPGHEAEHGRGDRAANRPRAGSRRAACRCVATVESPTARPRTAPTRPGAATPSDRRCRWRTAESSRSRPTSSRRRRLRHRRRRRCRSRCRSTGPARCSRTPARARCCPATRRCTAGRSPGRARRSRPTSRPRPRARRPRPQAGCMRRRTDVGAGDQVDQRERGHDEQRLQHLGQEPEADQRAGEQAATSSTPSPPHASFA